MERTFQAPAGDSAAAASGSFLQRWLGSSGGGPLRTEPEQQVPVAVIGLHRYLAPPQTRPMQQQQQEQQADSAHSHCYDVTLTDGAVRAKCVLHGGLNRLVQTNALRSGVNVVIIESRFVYDERRMGQGHVCVTKLAVCAAPSSVLPAVADVTSLPLVAARGNGGGGRTAAAARLDSTPLQLSRKHYLALWNDEDPEGSVWRGASHGGALPDVVLDVSKLILVRELESMAGIQRRLPPILVRILQKSRLRYYGKSGHKIDYPYQAYFEVADHSGIMSLVLWNELCPEWYQRLAVGTVLYLQGYTVKDSYAQRSRPQMQHHRIRIFQAAEIGLNTYSPTATITVVPPRCVPPQWGLPEVSYKFTSRSDVDSVPGGGACDVIGLVMFVSRVERVRETRAKGSEGPDKFWTYRWVHMVDGTSQDPFILQLFSPSRPDVFSVIRPMTYAVCTQMRVVQVPGSLPFLTSSSETEVFITGGHKGQPYKSDEKVKQFLQWTKTLKDVRVLLDRCMLGGHYSYPHPPLTFTQPGAGGSAGVPLVSAAELKAELDSLQYREHRRLAVQGHVVAVKYLTCPQSSDHHQVPGRSGPPHGGQRTEEPPTHDVSVKRRKLQHSHSTEGEEQEERWFDARGSPSPSAADLQVDPGEGVGGPSWQSASWPRLRAELRDHLHRGGLFPDSITQSFNVEDKDLLLHWTNLQPAHWNPGQPTLFQSNVDCPGYYQVTILGLNQDIAIDAAFLPVVSGEDPRAVGMPRDPQDPPQPNTLLSGLMSGFLRPPGDPGTPPHPEDIVSTAEDLKEAPLVWVLDVCFLGADRLEVLISRVHRVTPTGC